MEKSTGAKKERWRRPSAKDIHFDVDDYLNYFVLPSQLHRLPKPIARFLGYRKEPPPQVGNVLVALWAMLGAFLGLLFVGAVFKFSPVLQSYHPPVVFASLGATAILDYNAISSPLAQPRASIVGHGVAAFVGVCVAKLFELGPDFTNIRWIAGPISCGLASFVMAMTNTVHPPGGATALLAAIDPTVLAMGWMFIPLILLGSILMLPVALLVNNIQRQFPVFWWTPRDVGRMMKARDIESSGPGEETMAEKETVEFVGRTGFNQTIMLSPSHVLVPEGFPLDQEQAEVLEILRDRLREWSENESSNEKDSHFAFEGSDTTHVENVSPKVSNRIDGV